MLLATPTSTQSAFVLATPCSGGSRVGARKTHAPLSPVSFILMQFSEILLSNNRLVPPPLGLTPLFGKSWIWHWLVLLTPIRSDPHGARFPLSNTGKSAGKL